MVARRDVVTGRPGVVSEALAGDREPEHDDHETDLLDHASDSTWPSLPTGIGPWCRDRLDHPQRLVAGWQMPPDNPGRGDDGDGQEHPGDPRDLATGQHAGDHESGMDLDPAPHDEGHAHVVLDTPPDENEPHQEP